MSAKAKSAKTRKKKGRRYSDDEKREVLAFVNEVNLERGRGGITAASKKFNITPLTISNWRKKGGSDTAAGSNGNAVAHLRGLAAKAGDIKRLAKMIEEAQALRAKLGLEPIETVI